MATLIGKAQITTMSGATMYMLAAQTSTTSAPNFQSGSISHEGNVKETMNQSGQITTLFNSDEVLQQDFEFIPEAGSGNTVANAKIAAGLPAPLSVVTLSGFPIIAIGGFSDALNSVGTPSNPWIYRGGGKINEVIDDKWTMSVTLYRYLNITSGTPVT